MLPLSPCETLQTGFFDIASQLDPSHPLLALGKTISYPTDSKLAIKIINRLNKLAKKHGIKQRRTFVKIIGSW